MNKIDSFYDFLKDLVVNKDGSFDYDIKNRILDKYTKNTYLKSVRRRIIPLVVSEKREAA